MSREHGTVAARRASTRHGYDLIVINAALTPAVGEITYLSGRILDARGEPIRNALVEIWQVDKNGFYLRTKSDNYARRDTHFQGFGFAIKRKGRETFATQ